jgi:signal transduction histidine kinase
VDLKAILRDVSAELRDLAELKKIDVRTAYPRDEVVVRGSAPALRRLFLALLDNALKYSNNGGTVDVIVSADHAPITVTVKDRGIGIASADLPHIFRRFYRADKARTGDGYGLGLSIASTIAQEHSASISATSAEGEGSAFSVQFRYAGTNSS